MYYKRCVVVAVEACSLCQHVYFVLVVACHGREVEAKVVVFHLLEHTIRAHIEVVAGANVGRMVDVGFRSAVHVRLHGTRYDVLLRRHTCLLRSYCLHFQEVVDKRMVFCAEHYLRVISGLSRTDMVDTAVAHVGNGGATSMEFQEGHGRTHLLCCPRVLAVECIKRARHCLL